MSEDVKYLKLVEILFLKWCQNGFVLHFVFLSPALPLHVRHTVMFQVNTEYTAPCLHVHASLSS